MSPRRCIALEAVRCRQRQGITCYRSRESDGGRSIVPRALESARRRPRGATLAGIHLQARTPRMSREQKRLALASRARAVCELDALVGSHLTTLNLARLPELFFFRPRRSRHSIGMRGHALVPSISEPGARLAKATSGPTYPRKTRGGPKKSD